MPQPIDPFPIYKDGQKKVVHGVDYAGWAAQGWTLEPGEPVTVEESEPALGDALTSTGVANQELSPDSSTAGNPTPPTLLLTEPTPYEARKAQLESLLKETQGWRNIERIAKELGIAQKPAGGWDDAIPLILTEEGLTP